MIPIADVIRPRKTPWVTLVAIGLTVAAVAAEYALDGDRLRTIIYGWGLIPEMPRAAAAGTSLLLQPGMIGGLSNAAGLWFFGTNVEDRFGHARFAVLYLAAGIAGNLAEAWAHTGSPFAVTGTAGAVGGVIGAYFALYPSSRILFALPLPLTWSIDIVEAPAILLVGAWFLLQAIGADADITRTLVLGAPPVAAQLSGAAIGGITVLVLRKPLRMDWSEERA